MERSDFDFNLKTLPTLPTVDGSEEIREQVLNASRLKYATPRKEVEAMLRETGGKESVQVMTESKQSFFPDIEPKPDSTPAPKAVSPGKGGTEHKFIQHLLKQWGESLGFRATIEKGIPGSAEGIDVALERDSLSIACEISITTPVEYEMGNLQKCLVAGYTWVFAITETDERLNVLRKAATTAFEESDLSRLKFYTTTTVFAALHELASPNVEQKGQTVKGYEIEIQNDKTVDTPKPKTRWKLVQLLGSVLGKKKGEKK